jgi:hypothetical protein
MHKNNEVMMFTFEVASSHNTTAKLNISAL